MQDDPQSLVSVEWLAEHLNDPGLRLLDASWHMAATCRDPRAEFDSRRIPGAQFFDIDAVSDSGSDLPHMAPPPEVFAAHMRRLGIGPDDQVVVYDDADTHSAARAWWTFRLMGHERVAMLDGGLKAWTAAGHDLAHAEPRLRDPVDYTPSPRPALVRDAAQVEVASRDGGEQIVDARSPERFRGDAPEPRPGLRAGHIPQARNVPGGSLYDDSGRMKPLPELRAAFEEAGVDLSRPVITSCGSGITAASLSLALERLGHRAHALYDGSWAEWGADSNLKIATGDA
ncbi:3-mercaptopyruvate sulfurtransferase [Paracoccus jeotgali]|uniref:3-mercaptopyruvate sulfurtransferase n=1 Tax=Paracoccus jeotgali TaxID=2065379 RepID=UPI0028A88CA0|nr:3-mercaptopyruvate sulfurtransferase [Paracoccus jeotgali]